jgi:hypothetical protein
MILRHLRAVVALAILASAAVSAGAEPSLAATVSPAAPSAGRAVSPGGQIGIKLVQLTGSNASNIRAEEYIVGRLAPGAVLRREVQVSNLGSAPAELTLYPAAGSIARGTFQFAAGHTQDDMTTWISLSRSALTLAAHTTASLTATVSVPKNAPSGEQYGVIWAQEVSKGTGNVTLVSRVGIRLYLSIGLGGAAAAGFVLGTPDSGRTSAGIAFVRVPVHNTGGTAVDVRGTLQLSGGPGGVSAGPFPAETVDTLASGQSYPDTFTLSKSLPDGPWQASFSMVSGLITKTEKVTLNFNGAPATAAHTSKFPLVPVAAAVAALILLALAATLLTRSRRTRIMRARSV